MLSKAYPNAVEVQTNYGYLPIHVALHNNASEHVIDILLTASHKAAQVKDNGGNVPLHIALCCNASNDVIMMLFHVYPKAAEVKNNNEWLPLHYALCYNASSNVIKLLFEAFPKASEVRNIHGDLPLHYALKYNASKDVIKMLVDAFPGSTAVKNNMDQLPLDLYNGPQEIQQFVKVTYESETSSLNKLSTVLIGLCENAFQRKDKASYNNIQNSLDENENNQNLLSVAASYKDIHKATSLHLLVGAKAPFPLVKLIIDLAPGSLKVQDEEGRLLLHYASMYGASFNVINLLVDSFPESIDIRDNAGNCPLEYASTTQVQDLLHGADLPKAHDTKPKDQKQIYIVNKTGHTLKVFYHLAQPISSLSGMTANVTVLGSGVGGGFTKMQPNAPISGDPSVLIIQPDEKKPFHVDDKFKGIEFDFLCYSNELNGWALKYYVKQGYTQEIRGQPYKLK